MVRKILVVVDDRPVTQSAIDQAIEIAQTHRADIFFFGVVQRHGYPAIDMIPVSDVAIDSLQIQSAEETSARLAAASAWAERCGIHSHRATTVADDAAHAVADAAIKRHCDMIVVGTEDSNAVVRLLNGSIVPGLISKANVPVLVCKDRPLRTKRNSHMQRLFHNRPKPNEIGTRDHNEPND